MVGSRVEMGAVELKRERKTGAVGVMNQCGNRRLRSAVSRFSSKLQDRFSVNNSHISLNRNYYKLNT